MGQHESIGELWSRLTLKQKLYLTIMQLAGAMLLDFLLNLLFSWLKYRTSIENNVNIPVWGWPDLVAGHVVVETIVQSVLTWVIAGALVRGDVRRGKVEKLAFKVPSISHYLETQDFLTTDQTVGEFFRKLFLALIDGFKFAAVCVVLFAIPTVIVITIVQYAGGVEFTAWGTVWFTAAYGAVLGVTTPIPAITAMAHGNHDEEQHHSDSAPEVHVDGN